jgi:putative phosphoesterase
MQIGILSDTHSRHQTVRTALQLVRDRGVNLVLHCGDIEDVETVELFRGFAAHFVFGNCDGDREELRRAAARISATLHEPFGNLEQEGVKIAFLHGDDKRLLRDVEQSDAFDFVFYGHTHQVEEHRSGRTRVVNPGALHRARPKTLALLDLATRNLESVRVAE